VRDELALAERAAKGSRYRELLRSGEVTEALDGIEKQYADDLLNCQSHDERERLWLAVQVVRKVKSQLNSIDSDGKLAARQLAEIRRLRS
jgi:sulfur transfer protein SufE